MMLRSWPEIPELRTKNRRRIKSSDSDNHKVKAAKNRRTPKWSGK